MTRRVIPVHMVGDFEGVSPMTAPVAAIHTLREETYISRVRNAVVAYRYAGYIMSGNGSADFHYDVISRVTHAYGMTQEELFKYLSDVDLLEVEVK